MSQMYQFITIPNQFYINLNEKKSGEKTAKPFMLTIACFKKLA
jgi:hypothetical protein